MSGYSFRYIAAWQKVHELLQAGAVGEIQAITGSRHRPYVVGLEASPETGGGPMLYVGSHLVDQMLWYLGEEPVEVYADIRYRADTRADETTNSDGFAGRSGTGHGDADVPPVCTTSWISTAARDDRLRGSAGTRASRL